MASYDVIVLGLGGFGSSACYHAARHGASVLGLEQFTPAHDRGSSHGETRIIRQAYFEHPDYVPLLLRAYDLWRELEQVSGRALLQQVGLMIAGSPDGIAVPGTKLAAQQHGLQLESPSRTEAKERFPTFAIPEEYEIVYEATAGYLHVEECTRTHLEQAEKLGTDLRFETSVISWKSDGNRVIVRTERDEFTARNLIVTAGSWASRCLQELSLPLRVVRKFLAWFPVRPEFAVLAQAAPTFFLECGERQFYGFPSLEGRTLKMAEHTGGQPIDDPARIDRQQHRDDLEPLAGFVQNCLPSLSPAAARHAVCMYTLTPDHHFIVDRHPHLQNVVIACGFSGHGYKFTSVLGDVLAELALTGRTDLPISFLSLDRFRPAS